MILERQEELAHLESLDTGKPFWLANSIDIPRAAYNFHFFADYMISVNTDANQQDDQAIHYRTAVLLGLLALLSHGICHYYYLLGN